MQDPESIFIANASHELRTPLTIIRGFAETLQDIDRLSPKTIREIAAMIVKTCGRLDKLVRSLLTLADLENKSLDHFQPVELSLLIEHCKEMFLVAYPHAKVTCDLKPKTIIADPDLLDLAFMNILENAVRYSKEAPQITISSKEINSHIHIIVTDQGIGIDAIEIPRIFDRFYTVDKARSRKSGGTGLGLSIVKTVVDIHKGQVFVDSVLGKGSAFTIALPCDSTLSPFEALRPLAHLGTQSSDCAHHPGKPN